MIRLKSDIPLKLTSPILSDGSYLAELSDDGLTVQNGVIEYYTEVEGHEVPEMFCLVTDLTDIAGYQAPQLAAQRFDADADSLHRAQATIFPSKIT